MKAISGFTLPVVFEDNLGNRQTVNVQFPVTLHWSRARRTEDGTTTVACIVGVSIDDAVANFTAEGDFDPLASKP